MTAEDAPQPTRRERQAAETRREIVVAARRLFTQHGYTPSSMARIAEQAGVSVQTIYDSVGSKAELVRRLNDLIDEEAEVGPIAARIPDATSGVELVEIGVSISRNVTERCGDIIRATTLAAAAEPELAEVVDDGRRRHVEGITHLCERLATLGALRSNVSVEDAVEVWSALTDHQVAMTFVDAYGWTYDRWQTWTVDMLARLVLADPS